MTQLKSLEKELSDFLKTWHEQWYELSIQREEKVNYSNKKKREDFAKEMHERRLKFEAATAENEIFMAESSVRLRLSLKNLKICTLFSENHNLIHLLRLTRQSL